MAQHTSDVPERTEEESTEVTRLARARRTVPKLTGGNRVGTGALLAGTALLTRAIRSERRTVRSLQAYAGAALVGIGVRQRLSGSARDEPTTSETRRTREFYTTPGGAEREADIEPRADRGYEDVDLDYGADTGRGTDLADDNSFDADADDYREEEDGAQSFEDYTGDNPDDLDEHDEE